MLCHYLFDKSSAKRSSVHPYCFHGNQKDSVPTHMPLKAAVFLITLAFIKIDAQSHSFKLGCYQIVVSGD